MALQISFYNFLFIVVKNNFPKKVKKPILESQFLGTLKYVFGTNCIFLAWSK